MRIVVTSLDDRFDNLVKPSRRLLLNAAKQLKLSGLVIELYLMEGRLNNKKTFNVLAFPAPVDFPRPDLPKQKFLGEIYINPAYIQEHDEDLDYMLIHGFLHLLGYDHHKKDDRINMQKKEDYLLKKLHG
ncbi:MAG: rRNA maturation RNase YbeY [bacterium]|nr:rRNA maturation RNase YbeY [bacterium]